MTPKHFVRYSALIVIAIACLVLTGWYMDIILFIQIFPGLAAMQFNTALGFLLFGTSLLVFTYQRKTLGKILSLLGGFIGFLTLIQYFTNVDLGIDELLMEHYIDLEILYPGRMSPNTALCFFLSGIAILFSSQPFKKTQFSILLGLTVSGLGILALTGYLFQISNMYGWGNLPQMALHTSVGFIIVGAGIGGNIWLGKKKLYLNTSSEKGFLILLKTTGLILIFFTIDMFMPLGIAAGIPYMLVLAMSWRLNTDKAPLNLACLISIMVILGYYFSPKGAEGYIPIVNRIYALGGIWIAAILLYKLKIDARELKLLNKEIESQNNELKTAKLALQTSNEELAVFNEELTAANEELVEHQQTMQKLNEQVLWQSQLLEFGEKVAKLNTWILDLNRNHIESSPSYFDLFGIKSEELCVANIFAKKMEYIHPDNKVKMEQFYSQDFQDLPTSEEFRYFTPNGREKWFRDTVAFKFDDGKFLCITQDITNEKSTQEEMELAYEHLYVATEELTATNEELISAHYRLSQANEDLAFFSQSLNKILSINTYHYPTNQAKVKAYLELGCELMDMEIAVISTIEGETLTVEACIPDGIPFEKGQQIPLEKTDDPKILQPSSTVYYPNFAQVDQYHPLYKEVQPGAFIATPFWGVDSLQGTLHFSSLKPQVYELIEKKKDIIALISRNISNCIQQHEAKTVIEKANLELEERVYARTKELEKTNSYLDNFVHATAHDLRSPVANLKQISNLMIMIQENDDPILDKLSKSVERLDRTVSGLIKIIDAQKIENEVTKTLFFAEKMEQIMDDFKNQIQELNAKINTDLQVEEIVYLEPYLDCIMRNLIQNALKYSSPKRAPKILISTYREDGYIVLKIEDNGIGINLEEAGNRLFRAFKRFTDQSSGTGLGLHLVKSMVDKNDGKVVVESTVDIGTTFFIYLMEYRFQADCPPKALPLLQAKAN